MPTPLRQYQNSWGANVPATHDTGTGFSGYANFFTFSVAGYVLGARFFRMKPDAGAHIAFLLDETDNSVLRVASFLHKPALGTGVDGWQSTYFRKRFPVVVSHRYYISVWFSNGLVSYTTAALTGHTITTGDVVEPADSSTHWNGQFSNEATMQMSNTHGAGVRYGVDPIFWAPSRIP